MLQFTISPSVISDTAIIAYDISDVNILLGYFEVASQTGTSHNEQNLNLRRTKKVFIAACYNQSSVSMIRMEVVDDGCLIHDARESENYLTVSFDWKWLRVLEDSQDFHHTGY